MFLFKTKFIFIFLIFYCCLKYSAVNKDSLFKIIQSAKIQDTTKYYVYYDLGWEYIYSNTDSTFLFAQKAYTIAKKNRNKKNLPKVLNLLGAYFQIKTQYTRAIDYYQESLKIGEELKDPNIMLIAYGNIGSLYIVLGQFQKALYYQLKSLAIAEKNNKKDHLASIYNNLCLIYNTFKDYKKSVEYGDKSFEIYKSINDKNGICSATGNIGNAYHGLMNYDKALSYHKICYNTATEINNTYEEVRSLLDIGKVYEAKKNYKEALKYLIKGKSAAEINKDNSILLGIYMGLYTCYKQLGDKDKALENFELYAKINEIIKENIQEEEVNKKVIQFEFNKKTVSDSLKNDAERKYKDIILKANIAQIDKDRILKIVLTLGLLFFIGFGVLIFNRFRITSKQKIIIEAKNKQTEEQKLIIEEKQKEILDSINYAKRIQNALLDNFDSVNKFFSDAFILLKPKDIVSGDFYWLSKKIIEQNISASHSTVEELFFIAVCDSTGHGVPGGFMSLLNTSYLSEAINEKSIYEPHKIFDYVRDRLINTISKNDQKDGFDGVLMCFNKTFSYKNKQLLNTEIKLSYAAAHNSPVLVRNNQLINLEKNKMPVGFGERKENFSLFTYPIHKNDIIYVFTDGYADQFGGPKGKKFLLKQLLDSLLTVSHLDLNQQSEKLNIILEDWKGNLSQVDDVLIIGIRI